MLREESVRCACAADAQGFANLRGLYHHLRHKATFDCCPIGANPCHLVMFRALAERLAMARAPVPSELVEDLENDFPRLMEQRRDFVDDAATVVADDPFPVGATVELHGLHPNLARTVGAIVLNGRHVVVVPTPLDVAARGRINVVLDGAVHAVHRENLRAVATP